ncbi:hypothetical protein PHYBOEH_009185 [Phytophthora boehmeriae]|uniref:FYVE-type domain-containing protein n=1 Tax=Phytophthora boehmeriae TaxID=109152 RepID=A0A8T1VVW3_9STRA|nr:hypothetical protein PHYBOEH_009185 [Phytophthora boehmeriae]
MGPRPHAPNTSDLIHLPSKRKAALLQSMEDTEHNVGKMIRSIGDESSLSPWKLRMKKRGISYYVDDDVGKGLTRFCCVGLTDAPVADIMTMFMVSDTETLLKNVRIMYRNVKEAKILSVLKPPSRTDPNRSVYIRYASFDTPALMSGRDICVCVCTNMSTQPDGSTVGYCLWDSVDLPECPDRFATDKIIRSKMWHSGFFFSNSGRKNAVTKVFYIIGVEIGGIAPQLTGKVYMSIFGGNCRRVCKHYRKRTLDPETFKARADWTPKNEAKDCRLCKKPFFALSKRYHCVCCGGVVCGRCYFMEEVSVRGAVVTSVRICHECLYQAGMLGSNIQAIDARDSFDSLNSDGYGFRDLLGRDSSTGDLSVL